MNPILCQYKLRKDGDLLNGHLLCFLPDGFSWDRVEQAGDCHGAVAAVRAEKGYIDLVAHTLVYLPGEPKQDPYYPEVGKKLAKTVEESIEKTNRTYTRRKP